MSNVYYTPMEGTPYLIEPHVVPIAVTKLVTPLDQNAGVREFLKDLGQEEYLDDPQVGEDSEHLIKFAGQNCYQSFGPERTWNDKTGTYIDNLKAKGDGSVIEHADVTFLFYGVSRSLTHELVRHRAGFGFSQVSQRYVDKVRFVERPVYQGNAWFHDRFIARIDRTADEYERMIIDLDSFTPKVEGESKTERRKAIRQEARSLLPNETEAPIVVTANMRAWRHFIEMRASAYAEVEIRQLAFNAYLRLKEIAPMIFNDYTLDAAPYTVDTPYRKV